jgi:hypothetical protein
MLALRAAFGIRWASRFISGGEAARLKNSNHNMVPVMTVGKKSKMIPIFDRTNQMANATIEQKMDFTEERLSVLRPYKYPNRAAQRNPNALWKMTKGGSWKWECIEGRKKQANHGSIRGN